VHSQTNDPRIRLEALRDDGGFALMSRRNCSMAPRTLVALLAATALVHLGIGAAFAMVGLWMVLPFAGIELAVVAAAFYLNGRHATDYERIELDDGRLRLEVCEAAAVRSYEFNPAWVRVIVGQERGAVRLALRSHGTDIEIGRHLDTAGRERYAAMLRAQLAAAS